MKFIKCILLATLVVAIVSCEKKDETVNNKADAGVKETTAAAPAITKDTTVKAAEVAAPVKKESVSSNSDDSLIHITSEADFNAKIINSKTPALVDFYADWCGPCRMLAPTISKLAAEYNGKAVVAKVDIDNFKELGTKYKISSIPCVIFFKDGKEVDRIVGLRRIDSYKEALDKVL